jgi:hypothetical protein
MFLLLHFTFYILDFTFIHIFMFMNPVKPFFYAFLFVVCACSNKTDSKSSEDTNLAFDAFKPRLLDAYWKNEPSYSIYMGYGKYYDTLKVYDSAAIAGDSRFYRNCLDSLAQFSFEDLSDNNKISYRIIDNQLRSNLWYTDTLKLHEWDPGYYNIGGECYELLTRPYAPLAERLRLLSKHLRNTDTYFRSALTLLKQPTREHTLVAIQQNKGSLEVFGPSLNDSIKVSALNTAEKDTLLARVEVAKNAIREYTGILEKMLVDKNQVFRDFRIGETLFNRKFYYDIVSDYTARQIFDKALVAKKSYYKKMYEIAGQLWEKYCGKEPMPTDSLTVIRKVIDKISLKHVAPAHVFDTLNKHVYDLKRFIIEKDLFDFDTTAPLQVRKMPAFYAGVTLASAEFPLPYQEETVAYYNIADLTSIPAKDAESQLRENNDYALQILSIHEAIPGHCLQGMYNNKSADIVQAVFADGTMIEGWANYCHLMMLENGWGNNTPEMWLIFYKLCLRTCANVIIDYGIHCLNYSKEDVVNLLKNEAFQEDAQVMEKYNRATVTQVQLCSYFTGETEIRALRDLYQKQEGDNYSLKKFHEQFLSYGSSPVKYIRERMIIKGPDPR